MLAPLRWLISRARRRTTVVAPAPPATAPAADAAKEPKIHAHALSIDPAIVSILFPALETLHLMPADFPAPVCFLQGLTWSLQQPYALERTVALRAAHLQRRPQDRFIQLCNEPTEVPIATAAGLQAVLAPHNTFVDERQFFPISGEPVEFDAVLNAAFYPWKRHALAAEISRLALIGYADGGPAKADDPYYRQLKSLLPAARFCNEAPGGATRVLKAPEINLVLNRSGVGLALSEIEGGNYASMEYMLTGLPVVSTPSQGGRDYFFDPEYCAVVPPDARAIRDATAALLARRIPRDYIRSRTMARAERERRGFISFVQTLYDDAGVSRAFADEWNAVFTNKLHRLQPVHPFWRDLRARIEALTPAPSPAR
jgi:glycosyltransferase involved in cell wall biosynthesis